MTTNDELKKKILEIFEKAIGDWYEKDDGLFAEGYTPEEGDNRLKAFMADALIEAGLTFEPIVIRKVELSDECEKKIHELLKEEEASIEGITHRAFDAERAVQDWANASLDYTYDDAMEQAEKELVEEGKDND